ncbi:MAG: AAA domain-containing protein [Bacteroidota bacterium]
MPTKAQESLSELIHTLRLEKKEDYEQYQMKILNTSIQERRQKGVTWYPVNITNQYISTGERITIELEKTNDPDQNHSFQVGAVASLFSGYDDSGKATSGVISYLNKGKMRITLYTTDFPDWVNQEKVGVNLLFDENTYKEMESALKEVSQAERNRVAELREIMYGAQEATFSDGFDYQSVHLNSKQNEALTKIFNANDLAIIHGPPGTGKTTSMVHAIKDMVKSEKQVLVCAQSNAAVDLLVEKLDNLGLSVLRLGHPARLTPEVIENSLDVKISKHPSFKELKEVRKKSEELKRIGLKYKRNFGKNERIQRNMVLREARMLREDADRIEAYITEYLMNGAQVIACTLTGANHYLMRDRLFKTVFIDEASQALEPACWIPILKAQKVVMAGDHWQLPPTVKSIKAAKQGLEKTLFEKAINNTDSSVMLETQYRMHPVIMEFPSQYFYKGKLEAANDIIMRVEQESVPFEFVDTAGCGFQEKVKKETLSTYNREEAALLVKHLSQNLPEDKSVGIIAPYKAQIEVLTDLVAEAEAFDNIRENISINTVDAFQGQERDIIYIGLTRSNDKGEIGFLKEYRRMNVAMTRAKYKLVVIGDSATLGGDPFYDEVITYSQTSEGYRSAFELLYD